MNILFIIIIIIITVTDYNDESDDDQIEENQNQSKKRRKAFTKKTSSSSVPNLQNLNLSISLNNFIDDDDDNNEPSLSQNKIIDEEIDIDEFYENIINSTHLFALIKDLAGKSKNAKLEKDIPVNDKTVYSLIKMVFKNNILVRSEDNMSICK